MNEHQLGRLLRRLILLSAPLPLAVLGAACGGSTSNIDSEGGGATTGQAGSDAGGSASGGSRAGSSTGGSESEGGEGGSISLGGEGGSISLGGAGGSISLGGAAGSISMAGASGNSCRGVVDVSCSPYPTTVPSACIGSPIPVVGTVLKSETCTAICSNNFGCSLTSKTADTVTVQCQPGCAVGRRPAGLGESRSCDAGAAGSYFAEVAHLEAASVTAFRVLGNELRLQGAPKKLVRAAARAAKDEIRHARATGALARRFGAQPRKPVIAATKPRSLEAMAIENAVEGCVRETYGALLATRQAKLATDPVVRAAMLRIARDETRHAALSWRVASWLETRLDKTAKRKVAQAKQAAAAELIGELANEPEVSFAALAGLPSPAEGAQLAGQMQRELWS